ncbi:MAG: ATP-binding protein [Actinomycetes bacterium]
MTAPCWSGWSPTSSRTPSATTGPAAGSRSTPAAPAPWWWSGSPTPAPHPPDKVATLFEPFRRLGADRTGSDRGAGLGLSIVKAVAAAHGGRATARPLEDGGLEVTVELRR